LRDTPDGIALTVPSQEADTALAGLAAYDRESSRKTGVVDVSTPRIDWTGGIVAGAALVAFFGVTVLLNGLPWVERGSAQAARILDGELWRAVTALTLHGDVAHALSNGFAMAVFFAALSGQLGAGVAAALTLAAGAAGNAANAYLQGAPHNAVGASTAVFAIVGMLGTLALMQRRRAHESRRAWVGLAASLALLGMLGSSGARVDVGAHLLGFFAGGVWGSAVARFLPAAPESPAQWLCGLATIAVMVYCWILALS
jgi:membrane associated rhomboid family serine protease